MEAWLERIFSGPSALLRIGCFLSPPYSFQGIVGVQCFLADMGPVFGGHARVCFRPLCIPDDILLDGANNGTPSRIRQEQVCRNKESRKREKRIRREGPPGNQESLGERTRRVYNPRLTARLVLDPLDSGAYPQRSGKEMNSH